MLLAHPVIPVHFYVTKHLVSPRVQGWYDNVLNVVYSKDPRALAGGAPVPETRSAEVPRGTSADQGHLDTTVGRRPEVASGDPGSGARLRVVLLPVDPAALLARPRCSWARSRPVTTPGPPWRLVAARLALAVDQAAGPRDGSARRTARPGGCAAPGSPGAGPVLGAGHGGGGEHAGDADQRGGGGRSS